MNRKSEWEARRRPLVLAAIGALAIAGAAFAAVAQAATEHETYLQVAAARDTATFEAHDRDKDGRLTLAEVRGNIDFEARFDDFDINRDGVITHAELERYIGMHYEITAAAK